MSQIDIKNLSVTELKALLYDLNVFANQTQSNIKIISQELQNRTQALPETTSIS